MPSCFKAIHLLAMAMEKIHVIVITFFIQNSFRKSNQSCKIHPFNTTHTKLYTLFWTEKSKTIPYPLAHPHIGQYSWFNKSCFGHWELRIGKLLFGGHSLFHMFKCPVTNDQLPKQPFFIELYSTNKAMDERYKLRWFLSSELRFIQWIAVSMHVSFDQWEPSGLQSK